MSKPAPALFLVAGKGFSNLRDRSFVTRRVIRQGAALGKLVNLIPIIRPGGNFRVLKIHKIRNTATSNFTRHGKEDGGRTIPPRTDECYRALPQVCYASAKSKSRESRQR